MIYREKFCLRSDFRIEEQRGRKTWQDKKLPKKERVMNSPNEKLKVGIINDVKFYYKVRGNNFAQTDSVRII